MKTSRTARCRLPFRLLSILLTTAPLFTTSLFADSCNDAAGRLESAEGSVAVAGSSGSWQPLAIGDCIPVDSQVKVSNGRAVFRLANETLLRTAGETQLRFSSPQQKRWIHLIDGLLHLITRTPRDLEVESEYVNAAVKGTEFIVASDRANASGQVIVLEGEVVASNDLGSQPVTGGNAVVVSANEAPRYTNVPALRNAVQWTLHYPPLPLPSQPQFADINSAMKAGDLSAALRALDSVPNSERNADYLTLRAAIDLQRGELTSARTQLQQAVTLDANNSTAFALQAATEIATGNNDRADALLARSRDDDTIALITRSYLQQARFDLPAALVTAEQAAKLNSSNAWVQARVAELALMNGDTRRADEAIQRALTLNPNHGRANALNGFLQLQRLNLDAAEKAFTQAAKLDSSDPMPRLGLGLIEIRHNNLTAGREQLELAVALDPGQSLLRSYLGKAYQLEQRDALAGDQYALAKIFDDADPTPWLYGSLLAQSQNRPFEALQMIEESIARNDNRAVYRSRQQLDGDEATRTASQADIYRDLGFKELAQRSASRAVADAPGAYGGHRQLAESYADDPQYDAARASEVLQAQLLQPLSATPIQPLLAETDLLVTEGSGPGALGYRNYDALFVRERPSFQLAGLGGSNDTGAGQVSVSGIESRLAYAVDYYHYETQGYRENNDARYDIGSAYAGLEVNEALSLMLTFRQRNENIGDLTDHLFEQIRPYLEFENHVDTTTLGSRISLSPKVLLLASVTHREGTLTEDELQQTFFGELASVTEQSDTGDQIQIQSQFDQIAGEISIGAEWFELDRSFVRRISTTDPFLAPFVPSSPILGKGADRYESGYGYWSFDLLDDLVITTGIAYTEFDSNTLSEKFDDWYPKLAIAYQIHPALSLRTTYFESLKKPLMFEQSLETSQLGGFNQFLDDQEGTEAEQYGIGLDANLGEGHKLGFEWLERDTNIPFIAGSETEIVATEQTNILLFWSWATAPWAINLSYRYDQHKNKVDQIESIDFSLADNPSMLTTQRVPLKIGWHSNLGLSIVATMTYVEQKAERPLLQVGFDGMGFPFPFISIDESSDAFTLLDLALTYRFWDRNVEVSLLCNNMTDEEFRYESINLYDTTPRIAPYLPERTFQAGLKLLF